MATIIDFYSDLDLHDGQLKNAKIEQLASPPQNPETSRIYFNTTDSKFYGYNGLEWKLLEAISEKMLMAIEGATSESLPDTIVLRDENGGFEGDFFSGIDMHGTEIKNVVAEKLAEPPVSPLKGQFYFNTTSSGFYVYTGTTWSRLDFTEEQALAEFYTKTEIDTIETTLQNQIDGNIQTWFKEVVPTLTNEPYTLWTTTELKNQHLGDLYYDTVTGYCYRFSLVGETYSWGILTDTDVTKALADVVIAQTTANSKKRVFSATPTPPYDIGDLWTQGSSGDLMRCKTSTISGGTYSAAHWERAFKWDMARSTYDTNASGVVDNAEKVNGLSVQTAVPANAVFTDTLTTINGKTGIITKADIVALGIPAQDTDTITSIGGKVGVISKDDMVALGLPAQDTVYTHPLNHEPSIITQDASNRFVTDTQISTWTGKQSALGFTPENVANKGQVNGYAELGSDGKIPSSQLPTIPEGHTHINKAVLDKIAGGVETSYDLDTFVTDAQLADLGAGDMLKSVYDTDNDGIVDNAEKVNGLTVETAVPTGAIFTDTVYSHPTYTENASGFYKITTDTLGHVSSVTTVAKSDITGLGIPSEDTNTVTSINGKTGAIVKADIVALGIPSSDTTYSVATTSTNGLLSGTDKTKIDAITGTNTGDETSATIKTKLGITTLSGSNTGDQTLSSFGITSTAAELNALDGITATVTELNYTDGVTSNIQTQLSTKATTADLSTLELSKFSSYSTNMDSNGIYTNVEWKRANSTTYAKSTLTGTSPNYSQVTVDYYDAEGTTIINTITWNITYDANDFPYQRVVA